MSIIDRMFFRLRIRIKMIFLCVSVIEISSSIFLPLMADVEPVKEQNEELEPEQKRKVFIGSLSYNIDENAFRDYWTKFGNVL